MHESRDVTDKIGLKSILQRFYLDLWYTSGVHKKMEKVVILNPPPPPRPEN